MSRFENEVLEKTPQLTAAAFWIGKSCDRENLEFIKCKAQSPDPSVCLNQGRAVTACAQNLFSTIHSKCENVFQEYATCLDWNSFKFQNCRVKQSAFDKCMSDLPQFSKAKPQQPNTTDSHATLKH